MEHIVVEPVLLVPEALAVEGGRDQRVMLEELDRKVLVHAVVLGKHQRQLEHVLGVHRHPRGAVGLLEMARNGKR